MAPASTLSDNGSVARLVVVTAGAYLALGEPLYRALDSTFWSNALVLVGPCVIAAFSGAVTARRTTRRWAYATALVAASAAAIGFALLLTYLRLRQANSDGNKWECYYCLSGAELVMEAVLVIAVAMVGTTLVALACGALARTRSTLANAPPA